MLPVPSTVPTDDVHKPIIELVQSILITPAELAQHWGYTENHLANVRRMPGRGIPFIKLPLGSIRYRMSEVIAAELAGTEGPVSLERVQLAISTAPIPEKDRAAVLAHLRAAFGQG